jgi:iron complex outermembrane receptor protein
MRFKALVGSLMLLGMATHAVAQAGDQRVTITGSSIKRIQVEGALPVQVINRADLDRQGIVNAEQLISTLSTNGNGLDNLASNADVVSGAARGNNGSTSANLRGQGANATLILLNGRRVAAHGVNGGVVDLNQIPMAAVERVEVLKDGASSIYGTDAVGGVINFILRNNYSGLRAAASADVTEAGGGNIYRASMTGGLGNIDTDGFNLLATLSVTDAKILNGSDRDFVNTFQPERGLSPDTRGTPYATLFIPVAATGAAANNTIRNVLTRPGGATLGTGPLYNGATLQSVNTLDLPGRAGCASQQGTGPYDERLWNSAASAPAQQLGCAYDTGRATVIQQPVKNTNLVTRGTFKLGNHQITAEWLLGRSESAKRFSENQISSVPSTSNITLPNGSTTPNPFRSLAYPSTGAGYARVFNALVGTFPELAVNNGLPMTFRWRCMACGQREYTTTTDTGRLLLAADGSLPFLANWDYRIGVSQAYSKSSSLLGSGYHNYVGLARLISTGVLNPFILDGESQSAEAMAGLDAISARGTTLYGGKYTTTQADATLSGPVFKLPGGDALAAVGVDFRQEKYKFDGNVNVNTNDINTWIFNAAFDNINALSGVKRDVKAMFGEVVLPVVKSLELNLSARYDDYTGFGSTTNPKASLRFAPLDSLVIRASYGTGFRVPTFNQLYNGITESPNTGAGVADPATCPSGVVSNAPGCSAITFNTLFGGKPDLGPEESKMANVGVIWQPTPDISASIDWWDIKREGSIQSFSLATILANYTLFPQNFIRNADGSIRQIDTRWVNSGEMRTKGIELSLRAGTRLAGAVIAAGLDGTYLLEKKSRLLATSPFGSNEIGVFTRSGDLGIRWKHTAFVSYTRGDWVGTLRNQYSGGYAGYVPPGVANGNVKPELWDPMVKPYSIYHASVAYSGVKNMTITVGVKNLFDKDPPYANNYDTNLGTGSSWEPRVADPRGRSFLVGVDYKFF